MPGFVMTGADSESVQYTARIRPFLTHAQSARFYDGKAAFEITEITFQTSIGTYIDSPFHRYPDKRDIAGLGLDEVIRPGRVIDLRGRAPWQAVAASEVDLPAALAGAAVLFNFGWDARWGGDDYQGYPFIGRDLIDRLIEAEVKLVGVDTVNIDDKHDPERPVHSRILARDILVGENLCHLDRLHGLQFRFFALPIKARGTAAMRLCAFAELREAGGRAAADRAKPQESLDFFKLTNSETLKARISAHRPGVNPGASAKGVRRAAPEETDRHEPGAGQYRETG